MNSLLYPRGRRTKEPDIATQAPNVLGFTSAWPPSRDLDMDHGVAGGPWAPQQEDFTMASGEFGQNSQRTLWPTSDNTTLGYNQSAMRLFDGLGKHGEPREGGMAETEEKGEGEEEEEEDDDEGEWDHGFRIDR